MTGIDPALRAEISALTTAAVYRVVAARLGGKRGRKVAKAALHASVAEYDEAMRSEAWVRAQLRGGDSRPRWLGVRSADDDAWVAAQMARRARFIRNKLAPLLGIDPEAALAADRSGTLQTLMARTAGRGPLGIS